MTLLFIDEKKILGMGNERVCFIHPNDETKCIKVNQPGIVHRSQNKIEEYYFSKLKQRNVHFDHLAEYYGKIETDWGTGLVFERILDDDGSPSVRFSYAIEHNLIDPKQVETLLRQLKNYLITNAIYIGDCNKDQLLLQKTGNGMKLKVIDGVGTRNFDLKLKLINKFQCYARYKMSAKWPRLKRNFTVVSNK